MWHLNLPTQNYDLPTLYIKATKDRLISQKKSTEVTDIFKNIILTEVEGPHFILQAQPKETAILVKQFVETIA